MNKQGTESGCIDSDQEYLTIDCLVIYHIVFFVISRVFDVYIQT